MTNAKSIRIGFYIVSWWYAGMTCYCVETSEKELYTGCEIGKAADVIGISAAELHDLLNR